MLERRPSHLAQFDFTTLADRIWRNEARAYLWDDTPPT
jgi:hypothetical protein